MTIPLYGFLQGDTLGLVILVNETDTMEEVARNLQQAASVRVAPSVLPVVRVRGARVDPCCTVGQAGLTALDRIDVMMGGPS
jgi:hypothetical protein